MYVTKIKAQILAISLLTAPVLLAEDLDEGKIGTFKELGSGKCFALLIGVSEYEYSSEFVNLPYSRQEAEVLGQQLKELGFTTSVMTCKTPGETKAERTYIMKKVEALARAAGAKDSIFVYFSGHGLADEQGRNYLVAHNTRPNTVEDPEARTRTAIPITDITARLDKSACKRKTLWIDACREVVVMGNKKKLGRGFEKKEDDKTALVFSTQPGTFVQPREAQLTIKGEVVKTGLFAHFILKGLGGESDENGDGVLSFAELARFVKAGFGQKGYEENFEQEPHISWSGGKAEDIPLRIVPKVAPPPKEEPKDEAKKDEPKKAEPKPPEPPDLPGGTDRTEADHRRILADRLIWNKASEAEQDAAITWVGTKLGNAFEFVAAKTYSCGGQSHRIASFKHKKTGIEMNLIPGTENIKPFLDGRFELRQREWNVIGGDHDALDWTGDEMPMIEVNW